jgi:hypothetical protein
MIQIFCWRQGSAKRRRAVAKAIFKRKDGKGGRAWKFEGIHIGEQQ